MKTLTKQQLLDMQKRAMDAYCLIQLSIPHWNRKHPHLKRHIAQLYLDMATLEEYKPTKALKSAYDWAMSSVHHSIVRYADQVQIHHLLNPPT